MVHSMVLPLLHGPYQYNLMVCSGSMRNVVKWVHHYSQWLIYCILHQVPHTACVKPCHDCAGTGSRTCHHCRGAGRVRKSTVTNWGTMLLSFYIGMLYLVQWKWISSPATRGRSPRSRPPRSWSRSPWSWSWSPQSSSPCAYWHDSVPPLCWDWE